MLKQYIFFSALVIGYSKLRYPGQWYSLIYLQLLRAKPNSRKLRAKWLSGVLPLEKISQIEFIDGTVFLSNMFTNKLKLNLMLSF